MSMVIFTWSYRSTVCERDHGVEFMTVSNSSCICLELMINLKEVENNYLFFCIYASLNTTTLQSKFSPNPEAEEESGRREY